MIASAPWPPDPIKRSIQRVFNEWDKKILRHQLILIRLKKMLRAFHDLLLTARPVIQGIPFYDNCMHESYCIFFIIFICSKIDCLWHARVHDGSQFSEIITIDLYLPCNLPELQAIHSPHISADMFLLYCYKRWTEYLLFFWL